MKGRTVCFVCDGDVVTEDEPGRWTGIKPPMLVDLDVGLSIDLLACRRHADLDAWPAADYELASWMVRNGWGKPMDPAMLGEVQ
jgi:hypothetical protein